eukprot:14843.XXX_843824_843226_1 [CDS] Oithona nana genome sequencing.
MKNLFFAELTCYTCGEGASSNAKCNSQAIDIPCHLGLQVCKNELLVDDKGMTLLVTKLCVDKKSCIKGCVRLQNDSMACDDCCTSSYCNRDLRTPTQIENAVRNAASICITTSTKIEIIVIIMWSSMAAIIRNI